MPLPNAMALALEPVPKIAGMASSIIGTLQGIAQVTSATIGSVLYGSGYVLLAFLRNDLVLRLGWMTDQQLIDAVAIGQVTPGPVLTTATFIASENSVPVGVVTVRDFVVRSRRFAAAGNAIRASKTSPSGTPSVIRRTHARCHL